jgi:hypothetical protein
MKNSPLYRTDPDIEKMMGRMHPGFGVTLAAGMKRMEKTFPPVRAAWSPPLSHQRPVTPLAIRGKARFLFFPNADQEIRVTATKISGAGSLVRCDAYSADGTKITGAVLRPDNPVHFLGSAGQIYYVEVNGGQSYYELKLTGAPFALAANSEPLGVHVQGKATPFYFRVPAELPQLTITVSSAAPGETSLSRLYSPSGKLIRTFDTQTAPVARITLKPEEAPGDWNGFWCLSIEKAPKGVFDDVYVALDPSLPQWFILDPAEPLTITALNTVK